MHTSDSPDLSHKVVVGEGGGWHEASRYQIWTRAFDVAQPELTMVEIRPEGLIAIPGRSRLFHVAPAGIPHHIKHLYGFYRISESDTMFIRIENDASIAYTLIVGMHSPDYKNDAYAWFCPNCGAELQRVNFQTKRYGMTAFWDAATERARAFNADVAARTCKACGHVHPLAYGFEESGDTAEEAAARADW
jgi:rubredoxin